MKPGWVDRVNEASRTQPPPRSGKGSSLAAWLEYAENLGHEVPSGATRAQVMGLVEAGPPPKRFQGAPRVDGDVYRATRAAIESAAHLTEMDLAAVEVLLDLARTIDGFAERPAGGVDNWTVPTFLKYSDSLGLTPIGRKRLEVKLPPPESELDKMRRKRQMRHAG